MDSFRDFIASDLMTFICIPHSGDRDVGGGAMVSMMRHSVTQYGHCTPLVVPGAPVANVFPF